MKKKYYKVVIDKDNWWICSKSDLLTNFSDWLDEYECFKIETILMADDEFESLPEYQG